MKKKITKAGTCLLGQILILTLLNQSTVVAQCNNNSIFTVPSSYFGSDYVGNGNFNAIIFGNHSANSGDTEGRLAVGGNFTSPGSYSVGQANVSLGGNNAPDGDAVKGNDNFIVNGTFQNLGTNWGMKGNFVYNNAAEGATLPSFVPSTPIGKLKPGLSNQLNFASLKTYYQTTSATLAAMATNGVVTESYGTYTLKGETGQMMNVFELSLPAGKIESFSLNFVVENSSMIIVNVTNPDAITFKNGSMSINGVGLENRSIGAKVVFNFPMAKTINATGFEFIGSFLAPFATFNANGSSVNGQAIIGGDYVQNGGAEFHNFCYQPNFATLPVTLSDFQIMRSEQGVILKWQTTAETNSDRFEVQHSKNAKDWKELGIVNSAGESAVKQSYDLIDKNPVNGQNYYRLKMVDRDETYAFSSIRSIVIKNDNQVYVYPNPFTDEFSVKTSEFSSVKIMSLLASDGRAYALPLAQEKISVKSFQSGFYILQLTNADGTVTNKKILKK
jgi:choice-of-anchor A domain-containing protein